MERTVGGGGPAYSGCPRLPSVSHQPGTDIPHCPMVLQAGITREGWGLPPNTALGVYLELTAPQGESHRSGGSRQPLADAPGTGTPSLTEWWKRAHPGDWGQGECCHRQRFCYLFFLRPSSWHPVRPQFPAGNTAVLCPASPSPHGEASRVLPRGRVCTGAGKQLLGKLSCWV